MAKLSKAQIARHGEAESLLSLERALTDDERLFVLDNWQESARHVNSAAGAFFTPTGLARDFSIWTHGRVVDLCAGIGCLGVHAFWRGSVSPVCVEINPDYVAVGRRVFPEAAWIIASVEDAEGQFDCAISNPPFGKTAKIKGHGYSGEDDLAVVSIASRIADYGAFILPQMSVPFEYSGRDFYRERPSAKYDRFHKATGIALTVESVDCSYYRDDWRGVSPNVEMACADFTELRASEQGSLFDKAA